MKKFYLLMFLSIVACLSMNCSKPKVSQATLVTLQGLAYVDMHAPGYTTEHPLLCGEGRYYPGGTEMIFKHPGQEGEFHAVFPEDITAPQKGDLGTPLTLQGRFEAIKLTPDGEALEKLTRPVKRIPYGYRYFVVSNWNK